MNVLDLEHVEAQFGLLIREKENHDNYALLRFGDLDKVIEYYNSFKDEFNSKSNEKKMESTETTEDGIDDILEVQKKVAKVLEMLDKQSKNNGEKKK